MITALLLSLHFILLYTLFAIYAERKTAAFIQNRLGPYEVGPYGLWQPVADLLKLLQKEDLVPRDAQRPWFRLAPALPFLAVLCAFACVPVFPNTPFIDTSVGVLLVLSLLSLDVLGILMAGWASGNKFSIYGAFRAVGQLIGYEVPLGFALVAVVLVNQSMDFASIAAAQQPHAATKIPLFGFLPWNVAPVGGIFTWHVFAAPVLLPVAVVFFVCAMAQAHRTPFDLPETESELIAGYHTEYSGFRWTLFMLAEYGVLFLLSFLMVWLFLGAGYSPLPNVAGIPLADWTNDAGGARQGWFLCWVLAKTLLVVWVQMWVRWSLPRVRTDQLMHFCWRYLTPVSIILVYLAALWTFL